MSDAASNKKTFLGVDSQLFASSLLIIFAAFAGGVIGILTLIVLFFFYEARIWDGIQEQAWNRQ